jgi:hypothetical protein
MKPRVHSKLILFIGVSSLLLFYGCSRSSRIPTGSISESMKDENAFYTLRGGWDYDRLPLRYPFHILNVIGTPDLCKGSDVIVENVKAVNIYSNIIYGSRGPWIAFDRTNRSGWFLVEMTQTNDIFSMMEDEKNRIKDEAAFRQLLAQYGVTNLVLRPVEPLVKEFMYKGTLPFGR